MQFSQHIHFYPLGRTSSKRPKRRQMHFQVMTARRHAHL